MKQYHLRFNVAIVEGSPDTYDPKRVLKFEIAELLPANVDAQQHVRRRIAEEIKRNFDALVEPIDNKTEEGAAAEDPLTI